MCRRALCKNARRREQSREYALDISAFEYQNELQQSFTGGAIPMEPTKTEQLLSAAKQVNERRRVPLLDASASVAPQVKARRCQMDEESIFVGLWVSALIGIAVLPVLGWIEALQVLAFCLWFWVAQMQRERNNAWKHAAEQRPQIDELQRRLLRYQEQFGKLPEEQIKPRTLLALD